VETPSQQSFLARHEFVIRRLHSLSGLIPVGAFMTVHLLTNASILGSAALFQRNVYGIHSLGPLLPLVEWVFIFLPLIFHAVVGVVIVRGGLPNSNHYAYSSNIRYTLQRATGMIALVFIFWHVFHMHGWLHAKAWVEFAEPLNGANFDPYKAASTTAVAIQGMEDGNSAASQVQIANVLIPGLYAVGILACVYHLANGIWTMGITWGIWVSPAAQARANWLAIGVGVGLSVVGIGALGGFWSMDRDDIKAAEGIEKEMYDARVLLHEIDDNRHK
jgi:succinate dehydrogenase / fumarate reductase cytochrome b subunit